MELVYKKIEKNKPKIVFLNGKTCTGKTTLSRAMRQKYGCATIELDSVVAGIEGPRGKNPYVEAYKNRDDLEFTNRFIDTVHKKIIDSLEKYNFVIIDGAIVNTDTLLEIIGERVNSYLLIYLDIKNIEEYTKRLKSRFESSSPGNRNGLPSLFWDKFKPELLEQYYADRRLTESVDAAIRSYASDSTKESEGRLAKLSSRLDHILKVEI